MADALSTDRIQGLLDYAEAQFSEVTLKARLRRILISRNPSGADDQNRIGINLPYPYNSTTLAVRYLGHEPAQATQFYASRLAANLPEVSVVPVTQHDKVTETVDKMAGEQERLTGELLDAAGLPEFMREGGWAMSSLGCTFAVVMPRDADWGLPARASFEDYTDKEIERLQHEGKINRFPSHVKDDGTPVYAEAQNIWKARRKQAMHDRVVSGNSLFTIRNWPLDQVLFENDRDSNRLGPKWFAGVEEIPAYGCMEGSAIALSAAKRNLIHPSLVGQYGLWVKDGRVIGGVSVGVPKDSSGWKRPEWFTLVRFYDREEQIVMVCPMGSVHGGFEVFRGAHGCTVMGAPANPAVEFPFYKTDTNVPMQAYSTPIDGVIALSPLINQMKTLLSNAEAWNLIPRLVNLVKDGTTVRGEDGEPIEPGTAAPVPGLDPSQISQYVGDVKPIVIDTANTNTLLQLLMTAMAEAMPSPAATGSASSDTAWGTQIAIEQQQALLKEPSDHITRGVRGVVWRMYGWLRTLDVPVMFHTAPRQRENTRSARGLIEFDPKDLTDSIVVTQDQDTPEEAVVRAQVGTTLWQTGAINDEQYAEKYLKEQDVRAWQRNRFAQIILNYVAYGAVPQGVNPQLFSQSLM